MNRSMVTATVVKTEPIQNTLTRWHRWTSLRWQPHWWKLSQYKTHLPDDTDEPLYGDSHSGENWANTKCTYQITQMNLSKVTATLVKSCGYTKHTYQMTRWTALRHLPDDADEALYGDSHRGENWAYIHKHITGIHPHTWNNGEVSNKSSGSDCCKNCRLCTSSKTYYIPIVSSSNGKVSLPQWYLKVIDFHLLCVF